MSFPDCKFKNECNLYLSHADPGADDGQLCLRMVRTKSPEKPIDYICYHEESVHLNTVVTTES